jgi:lipid II:glycine glycyltransferase (peptidoglycan interpeptide bridge formation enzyme)
MKTTTLLCYHCGQSFNKLTKEVTRQKKLRGTTIRFFCSRACSGQGNKFNFGSYYGVGDTNQLIPANRRDEYSPFRQFLRSAKKRHNEVDVDLQYLKELWQIQNEICALTGLKMTLSRGENSARQASLDRIDSSKGYVKGNVQYVVLPINLAKSTLSDEIIRKWVDDIKKI